jgi:hypothetical protein
MSASVRPLLSSGPAVLSCFTCHTTCFFTCHPQPCHLQAGWQYLTGLARQRICRKAQYEAKAGGMNHDVCVYVCVFVGSHQLHMRPSRRVCVQCVCSLLICTVMDAKARSRSPTSHSHPHNPLSTAHLHHGGCKGKVALLPQRIRQAHKHSLRTQHSTQLTYDLGTSVL